MVDFEAIIPFSHVTKMRLNYRISGKNIFLRTAARAVPRILVGSRVEDYVRKQQMPFPSSAYCFAVSFVGSRGAKYTCLPHIFQRNRHISDMFSLLKRKFSWKLFIERKEQKFLMTSSDKEEICTRGARQADVGCAWYIQKAF
jgi:hypothetical protein